MIRETVYQFCQAELLPIADEVDAKNEFPRHLWEKMGALGMHGITVSEEDAQEWVDLVQPIYASWISDMAKRGKDGQALIDEARALMEEYEKNNM